MNTSLRAIFGWGIPGEKLDKGESPLQTVLRKIQEETGYHFSEQSVESLGTVYIEYNDKDPFVYHMFRTKLSGSPADVKINFTEHKRFTWVTPQDGLKLELIKDEDACFKLIYNVIKNKRKRFFEVNLAVWYAAVSIFSLCKISLGSKR